MRIRAFTEEGIEYFHSALSELRETGSVERLRGLVLDPSVTVETPISADLPALTPDTSRFVWAQVAEAHIRPEEIPRDLRKGTWSWLAAFYFDAVCPVRADGTRLVREDARYIPSLTDYRNYYRHALLGPWSVFRAHAAAPERARVVLFGPLASPGEAAEQLMSRQDLVTNPTVLETAYRLYFDPSKNRLKKGAGGKAAGSPRRLADILYQFDLTFDLFALTPEQLLSLLPGEFNRFLE